MLTRSLRPWALAALLVAGEAPAQVGGVDAAAGQESAGEESAGQESATDAAAGEESAGEESATDAAAGQESAGQESAGAEQEAPQAGPGAGSLVDFDSLSESEPRGSGFEGGGCRCTVAAAPEPREVALCFAFVLAFLSRRRRCAAGARQATRKA